MRTITCLLAFPAVALAACNEPLPPSDASAPSLQLSSAFTLVSTIAFVNTRDDPTGNPLLAAEIYLMDGDAIGVNSGNPRRVTNNSDGDGFPALSPDGKKDRVRQQPAASRGRPPQYLGPVRDEYRWDGYEERGPSWSPDGTRIVSSCRRGGSDFEICLMNAAEAPDETKVQQLTNNAVGEAQLTAK